MKKSMIAILVILVLAAGSLTWMLGWMTDLIRPELEAGGEWSRTYAEMLAPDEKLSVTYVPGGADRPVSGAGQRGLFVKVPLSDATWAKPGAPEGVAFGIAQAAFERYGSDRPIAWVQTKLVKKGGALGRELAFAKDASGVLVPVPYREGERLGPAALPSKPAAMGEGGDAPRPPSVR